VVRRKKEDTHSFTVNFPKSLVEEIDVICSSEFITRTSWLVRAARELMEKERKKKSEELLEKLRENTEQQ
jgi:metal-responsive CopG/Arc/MetJ family transcriptional regulator